MKKRTSADMLCIAEYTLKHLYNLNVHAPKNVEFKMSYDAERDVLVLSDYGEYVRANEE